MIGSGILRGMAVTGRNFLGSYFEKDRLTTVQYIIKSEDKKPDYMGKPQFYPAVFHIDISVCMSCQICVEVCPFEAIKMDKVFELSTRERFDALLQRKGELSKSNTYYHGIHPVEAA